MMIMGLQKSQKNVVKLEYWRYTPELANGENQDQ